jgi:hypothetical protein
VSSFSTGRYPAAFFLGIRSAKSHAHMCPPCLGEACGQTVPSQLKQPTDRPTLRWIFQCFEGVSLVVFQPSHGPPQRDLAGLQPLHKQVLRLLGPYCEPLYARGA